MVNSAISDGVKLAIHRLNYAVNRVPILKQITITISPGEFVGFIGPNGAGKTTLLKCINGLYPTQGAVTLNNTPITHLSAKRLAQHIALMHQNTTLTFPFPSIEVVLMGRYPHLKRMQSESKDDIRIARENMAYTDTLQFERTPITQLSGGERQRVFFAKTLTQQTDIILLDEPTASLDLTHQEQLFKYAGELARSGKTIIAAVHDLKTAARYCSRLVLLNQGEILADGRPAEVLTSAHIADAYNVNALVYQNPYTGVLDFHLYHRAAAAKVGVAHVIGGGGSACGVIRYLFEQGYTLSAGIFFVGDSDLKCAEVFGIPTISSPPFSEIDASTLADVTRRIQTADVTILCNLPFGPHNLHNLIAAQSANRLIIIEDDPIENRDFTGGQAAVLYQALRARATVTTSARLHEVV